MPKPEVMDKLVKMIPLLASDKPGEVTAAAAAITRSLKGAALDWHDVVKWIESGQMRPHQSSNSRSDAWERSNSEAEQRRQREERQRRERAQADGYQGRSSYKADEAPADWKPTLNSAQYQGLARRCLAADTTYLSAMELEFLKSATEWNSWATFKQERWIKKIAAKLRVTV